MNLDDIWHSCCISGMMAVTLTHLQLDRKGKVTRIYRLKTKGTTEHNNPRRLTLPSSPQKENIAGKSVKTNG